jgi:chemotaxis protein methyltransferase CheR
MPQALRNSAGMQFRADSLGLAGRVTEILRDLIHERLGLFYGPSQFDQLADRLAPLVVVRGLGSFMDYYYLLKYEDAVDEWRRVMDALAVQETYFWREIDQVRAIVEHVVPRLVGKLRSPLRIWSVPCATGEEPLTIAILLEELGWFDRASIEITASDASPAALDKAARGHYGARAFRNLPAALKEKYFTPAGNGWSVTPELRRRVSYDEVNLVSADEVARRASVPIIFCRNVFIYFSDDSIRRVITTFERAMPSPAYLCVGASESLLRLRTSFELQEIGGAFIYRKDETGAGGLPAVFAESRHERV